MFADYLKFVEQSTYETYNKLTVNVEEGNPCVEGFNAQDLTADIILGQVNEIDIPFDDGECKFTLEVVYADETSVDFGAMYSYTPPTFTQKAG